MCNMYQRSVWTWCVLAGNTHTVKWLTTVFPYINLFGFIGCERATSTLFLLDCCFFLFVRMCHFWWTSTWVLPTSGYIRSSVAYRVWHLVVYFEFPKHYCVTCVFKPCIRLFCILLSYLRGVICSISIQIVLNFIGWLVCQIRYFLNKII